MKINIPTGQDILRDIAIQYVNKAFVYIANCNQLLSAILFDKEQFILKIQMVKNIFEKIASAPPIGRGPVRICCYLLILLVTWSVLYL